MPHASCHIPSRWQAVPSHGVAQDAQAATDTPKAEAAAWVAPYQMFIHSWLHDRSAASRCPAHCCGLTRALALNARTQCGPGSSLCQRADAAAAFAIGCADGRGPVPMLRRLRSSRLAVLIASVVIGSLLLITGHLDGFKLVATTSAGSEVLPNAAPA
jgi:hypothetical protein